MFEGYQEVDYITSDSNQYIDTGIKPNKISFVEFPKQYIYPTIYDKYTIRELRRIQKFLTWSKFFKVTIYDNDKVVQKIELCRKKEDDALGYYNYKQSKFYYYNLKSGKLTFDKPKKFITQSMINDYIIQYGRTFEYEGKYYTIE